MSYSTVIQHILFQSTLSARRATSAIRALRRSSRISIHALREESDQRRHNASRTQRHISIHALREESDAERTRFKIVFHIISIHALREESDQYNQNQMFFSFLFQSTLSARRATLQPEKHSHQRQFQSTLSARRATVYNLYDSGYHYISIHALREESDLRL